MFYGAEHGAGAGQTVATLRNRRPGAAGSSAPSTGPVVPQGAQNIRRIEARGGVTVISKDQNASGDLGVYDLKKKTITLTGNVVVSQGKNVLHGERVVVDTTTGNAAFRVDARPVAKRGPARSILPSKNQNGGSSNFLSIGPGRETSRIRRWAAPASAAENRLNSPV